LLPNECFSCSCLQNVKLIAFQAGRRREELFLCVIPFATAEPRLGETKGQSEVGREGYTVTQQFPPFLEHVLQ